MTASTGETGTDGAQGGASGDGTTGQSAGTASNNSTDATVNDAQSGAEEQDAKVERAEYERIKSQLQAADRRRQELEDANKAAEDAKKDELTKATERAEGLESRNAALAQEVQALRLERAMLTDAEFGAAVWQDPEEVLDKINRAVAEERVTVKDGQPDGASVKAFLKDLSIKKPYLLKSTTGTATATGKSGASVGAGDRRTAGQAATDDELKLKYRIR